MIKNIKKKNAPSGRSFLYHINIFTERFVIIRSIDRGIGVTFYVIITPNFFIADDFVEIFPIPFFIRRPFFSKVFYNQRYFGLIIFSFELGRSNIVNNIY